MNSNFSTGFGYSGTPCMGQTTPYTPQMQFPNMGNTPMESRRAAQYGNFPKPTYPWEFFHNCGYWYCRKSPGESIPIGSFSIDEFTTIGMREDGRFKNIVIRYTVNGVQHITKLTFNQFRSRNMLKYFEHFVKHPRCSISLANDLIYALLQQCQNGYTLTIPERPGWVGLGTGMAAFATGNAIPEEWKEYYPACVKSRLLLNTGQVAYTYLLELDRCLKDQWKLKTVYLGRVSSLVQTILGTLGLHSQCILVVEPSASVTADVLTASMKTQNYLTVTTNPLDASDTAIGKALDEVNDGTIVFRDGCYLDETKRIRSGLDCLLRDVQRVDGNEQRVLHQICIISKYAGRLLPPERTCCLSFEDVQMDMDSKQIQQIAGQLDFLLIQWIQQNIRFVMETMRETLCEVEIGFPQEIAPPKRSVLKMLLIGHKLYQMCFNYSMLDTTDVNQILEWLKSRKEYIDISQTIVDDFASALNKNIREGVYKLLEKTDAFEPETDSIVVYEDALCFEPETIERLVSQQMTTTQSPNTLMQAMDECGYPCATNKRRRPIQMYTPAGRRITIHSYSVIQKILDADNQYRVSNLGNEEFLIRNEDERDYVLPLVCESDLRAAGRKLIYGDAENNHIYVTGQSGYGKTFALSQLAAFHACLGFKVVILDASDSFRKEAMHRNLPEKYVRTHVRFHSLERDGIPVNLFDLSECYSLPNKKKSLMKVLTAATRELSVTQANAMKQMLSVMLGKMSDGETVRTDDILEMIDPEDRTGASLMARLSPVFEDLDACGMSSGTWEEFFRTASPITVISTETADTENGTQILDMVIASLSQYQKRHSERSLAICIDELQNQNFDTDGPISRILKEGRKYHISFIGATQSFFASKSRLGDTMSKADTKIFLRPTRDSEQAVALELRWGKAEIERFDRMERGDCIVKGNLFSRDKGRNCPAIISGTVPKFISGE